MWPCNYVASHICGAADGLLRRLVECRLDAIKTTPLSTTAWRGRAVPAIHSSEEHYGRNLPSEMVECSGNFFGAQIGYDLRRDITFYPRPGVPVRALEQTNRFDFYANDARRFRKV